jgi:hypothetical protein
MDFLPTRCPEARGSWQEGSSSGAHGQSGLGGYLLAWASALSYCGGLFCLAVLPRHAVAVPRWLIFAYGVGCALAFGAGPHLCLGMTLARRELETSLGRLVRRLPRLRFDEEPPRRRSDSLVLRGLESFPVRFDS